MKQALAIWLLAGFASSALALELNRTFSDHMVLQRGKPVHVRGTADAGEEVTVSFAEQTGTSTADKDGHWHVVLDPLPAAAEGRKMKVSGKGGNVELQNVVVGDVFLHARQSSIDISLGRGATGAKATKAIKVNPLLRVMTIRNIPSAIPLRDLADEATPGWAIVDKNTAPNITASAFYLGRELVVGKEVPIGIIDLNMGSAFANGWLSRETLLDTGKLFDDKEVANHVTKYEEMLEAERNGVPYKKKKTPPVDTLLHPLFPAGGYNGTIRPLAGLGLKAVLLQLGNDYPYMIYEAIRKSDDPFNRPVLSSAYDETYNILKVGFRMEDKTVPRVPREWRDCLGDPELPFGLITPPGSELNILAQHHREMRELQRLAAVDTPGIGIIIPGTESIRFSAQPADEALLASRCMKWIQGDVYREANIPSSGPMFERFEATYNEAVIHFKKGSAKGLKASKDALNQFEAANVEGDYYPAKAVIEGETIRIQSDDVTRINRIRYNWKRLPDEGLVNIAGLPAIPFRSERAAYHWFVRNEEEDLPEEYFLPANEWNKNDVTLINVAALTKVGYNNFTGWIGPAGFKSGPFGPNMEVGEIKPGSPAEGKLIPGDVIYSANGNMLGDKPWEVMAAAITESETREAGGKLLLGLRRGSKTIDVTLTLEVMGTYSSTAPFDCPKTEKIIADLEQWVINRGADAGFLNYDAVFLLATGNPETLGYVRRAVYKILASNDPTAEIDPLKAGKSWYNSANAFLLGEYYMSTGDRNVLPHLKNYCDRLAVTQDPLGGWRHNNKPGSAYGMIPNAGMPGVMGMHFAHKAGLDIDMEAYKRGLHHFTFGRAETGSMIYGNGQHARPIPVRFDPSKIESGTMNSVNGGLSCAGILMGFVDNHRAAHMCSAISTYAFNNTFGGHGGNFWNNFWTPLGANQHSKESFIHFWKGHRWYRELARMHDGILTPGGKESAGFGIPLVAPRRRIQIVGAPASPFTTDASPLMKPALEAYRNRDYAEAEQLARKLLDSLEISKEDLPTIHYLIRAAAELSASIEADLTRMEQLIDAGNAVEAKTFLPGLEGVAPKDNARLLAIQKALADVEIPAKKKPKKPTTASNAEKPREWECLVLDNQYEDLNKIRRKGSGSFIPTRRDSPNIWKLQVLENIDHAPEDWASPKFDDSEWMETDLPVSWHMYHTALLRTRFNVDDKKRFDALRLHSWVLRQQGVEIYLNGELIAKINNVGKTTEIAYELKESCMKHLRTGENTLAITARHDWRWGRSFMHVYNDGFDFNLDARLKR